MREWFVRFIKLACLLIMVIAVIWIFAAMPVHQKDMPVTDATLLKLSEKLLYAVKTEESLDSVANALAAFSTDDLNQSLSNDEARKTFWINLYNAWYQILAIRDEMSSPEIFTIKAIPFADYTFSLDDIEHGILRRYRWKYSMGYMPQFLPDRIIKRLAVQNIDYRIHFALNCGAKSCPPIAFYSYQKIDEQLELATRSFLIAETDVDFKMKVAHVTRIMYWFKGDFGGDDGIRNILSKYLNQDFAVIKIKFKEYDWTKSLKNFNP